MTYNYRGSKNCIIILYTQHLPHCAWSCMYFLQCHCIIYSLLCIIPVVALVGLERTIFTVSEDVGVVEVCAVIYHPHIDCPIQFPFQVKLTIADGTAGKFSPTSMHAIIIILGTCWAVRTSGSDPADGCVSCTYRYTPASRGSA